MSEINADSLRYGGFWRRLGALLLDIVIMVPCLALSVWGTDHYRMFAAYDVLPGSIFGLFYSVYLVRRFGGTPGKLIVGLRIRKLDGEPVGYREVFLRYFPDFVFGLLISVGKVFARLKMSNSEYYGVSFMERSIRMAALYPSWMKPLDIIRNVWFWGELIVLLTNRKRRALHDFIAGTVVVVRELGLSAAAPVAVAAPGD